MGGSPGRRLETLSVEQLDQRDLMELASQTIENVSGGKELTCPASLFHAGAKRLLKTGEVKLMSDFKLARKADISPD